jgi:hypothetical protein
MSFKTSRKRKGFLLNQLYKPLKPDCPENTMTGIYKLNDRTILVALPGNLLIQKAAVSNDILFVETSAGYLDIDVPAGEWGIRGTIEEVLDNLNKSSRMMAMFSDFSQLHILDAIESIERLIREHTILQGIVLLK